MEQNNSYSLILTKDQADYLAAGKYGPNRVSWLAPFSLLFNNLFCRIWLAGAWHIVMSRKGTCILSYPLPFFRGRKGQAQKRGVLDCAGFEPTRETASSVRQNLRINRHFADISLLDPWQLSTWFIHKWVLSYPDAFGVGKTRASPVGSNKRQCKVRGAQDSFDIRGMNGKAY